MFNFQQNKFQTLSITSLLILSLAACSQKATQEASKPSDHHAESSESSQGMDKHTSAQGYELVGQIIPNPAQPNGKFTLSFQIKDENGNIVKEFERHHEKLAHLIIVREDLAYFYHEHPELKADGTFTIDLTLPQPGKYKYFVDYVAGGDREGLGKGTFEITGNSETVPLAVDKIFTKEIDGIKVSMKPENFAVGEDIMLTFNLADAKTGKPITDLEKYLGALGHGVVISQDSQTYLHVHPMTENGSGPEVMFHTKFSKPGIYKIWGQFKRQGKVLIADYTIRVI